MTNTPGQVAYQAFYEVDQTTWPKEVSYLWDAVAAAVIAHVRPQIEAEAQLVIEQKNARIASCEAALEDANARVAEARASMVEQIIDLDLANVISRDVAEIPYRDSPEDQPEMMLVTQLELRDIVERHIELIGELAALPPTHVCVPVEPTEAMIEASMQAPTALELHKGVTTDAWELLKESSILRYKAMLAASKGKT